MAPSNPSPQADRPPQWAAAVPRAPRPVPVAAPATQPPRLPESPAVAAAAGQPQHAPRPIPIPVERGGEARQLVFREPERDPDADLKRWAFKEAPPWLVSCLVHMLLVVVLGLWVIAGNRHSQEIVLEVFAADQLGEQLEQPVVSLPDEPANDPETTLTPTNLPEVDDPFASPPTIDVPLHGLPSQVDISAPAVGLALRGREEGMKEALLRAYGGNADSEKAVEAGLEWLSRQQRKDGSWSLKGPYGAGSQDPIDNIQAATAMALLAFQGAGHTHQGGKYQKEVAEGLKMLLKWQDGEGNFFPKGGRSHNWMYTQAQCSIALCELYGMTRDSALRGQAQRAIDFCAEAQDAEQGGWRYIPRNDSDTSVTGWVVMALQSGRMAGLDVPSTTLEQTSRFLDLAAHEEGSRYGYQPGTLPTLAMTAEGLLCRQYLGWDRYDPRLIAGADYLRQNLPRWEDRDVYYWYYGTQVMHHMEGEYWQAWNGAMRDMLVEHQEQQGRERGSWDPLGKSPDIWAARGQGGRLYTTCLSLYMLEVYYRHLPLYSKLRSELERR